MAIDYKIGDKLYLPVTVINGASQPHHIRVDFFCDIDTVTHVAIANKPGLLLTAEEVADNDAQGDLVTAKAAIDYLQEENKKLKEEMEGMDIAHKSLCECNFKYSHRLDDQYEVIRALVEKIRRLEKANETVCITKPV